MIGQHVPPTDADDASNDERSDDRIVQWPDERDELRYEVDRGEDPGDAKNKEELGARWDPRVTEQAFEQDDEIRQQRRDLTSEDPAPGEGEEPRESQPRREHNDKDQDKRAHRASAYRSPTQRRGTPAFGSPWRRSSSLSEP